MEGPFAALVVGGVIGAVILSIVLDVSGGTETISPPAAGDAEATAAELGRAATAQGICYGWELLDVNRHGVLSYGSSLGASVSVESDHTRCPRWVLLSASVEWTPAWSEAADRGSRRITSSGDIQPPHVARLDRLGFTVDALIDEPAEAVLRGVLALPLLVAEDGIAPPVPMATTVVTADPAELVGAGSDRWRADAVPIWGGLTLFGFAALLLGAGWWATHRERVVAERRDAAKAAADLRVAAIKERAKRRRRR